MNTLKKEKLYKYDELYKMINFINENLKQGDKPRFLILILLKFSQSLFFPLIHKWMNTLKKETLYKYTRWLIL